MGIDQLAPLYAVECEADALGSFPFASPKLELVRAGVSPGQAVVCCLELTGKCSTSAASCFTYYGPRPFRTGATTVLWFVFKAWGANFRFASNNSVYHVSPRSVKSLPPPPLIGKRLPIVRVVTMSLCLSTPRTSSRKEILQPLVRLPNYIHFH